MNRTLENKFSMYLAVQKICDDNVILWTDIPACSDAVMAFKNKILAIQSTRQIQESNPVGIAMDKAAKKTIMAEKAMLIKGAIQAYATSVSNNELYESVNYSLTELLKPADTISRDRALLIYNRADAFPANLENYGITTTMVTDFQNSITGFTDIIATPRTARSAIKSATATITTLFADCDIILKREMDMLMIQFKSTNNAYYQTYSNARQIINSGKGSQTLEVELNANQFKTVQRVINGSVLTNTGVSVLRYCADRLPPCDAGDENAVLIQPGSSITVDIEQTFVTVTNVDTVKAGRFKVKVTSTVAVTTPR